MDVETLAAKLNDHLVNCEAANIRTADAIETLSRDVREMKELPMKAVRWLGLTVGGAVISILVQNFWLHQDTAHKADVAAVQATQAAQAVSQIPSRTADAVGAKLAGKPQGDQ